MTFTKIKIGSFGSLEERVFTFADGVNFICGDNESGKSTLAMFIKFIFYGLSGKTDEYGMSERKRYISWSHATASGSLEFTCGGLHPGTYRVERVLQASTTSSGREGYREGVRVVDLSTSMQIKPEGSVGLWFLGVSEEVFCNTVFVRQLSGADVDGSGIADGIENLLLSGDETLDTKKAVERLDAARRQLKPKNNRAGGEIYALEAQRDRLEASLEAARSGSAELIATEASVSASAAKLAVAEEKIAELVRKTAAADARDTVEKIDAARAADAKIAKLKSDAEGKNSPDRAVLERIRRCRRNLSEVCAESVNADFEYAEAQKNAADVISDPLATMTDGEIAALKKEAAQEIIMATAAKKTLFSVGALVMALGLVATAAGIAMYRISEGASFYVMLFAGLFIAAAVTLFVCAGAKNRVINGVCDKWNASDFASLDTAIDDRAEAARAAIEADASLNGARAAAIDAADRFYACADEARELCAAVGITTQPTEILSDTADEVNNGFTDTATDEFGSGLSGKFNDGLSGKFGSGLSDKFGSGSSGKFGYGLSGKFNDGFSDEATDGFSDAAPADKRALADALLTSLNNAEEYCERSVGESEQTAAALANLTERRAMLSPAVDGLTAAEIAALRETAAGADASTTEQIREYRRELEFLRKARESLVKQSHEKELRLASLKATASDPCAAFEALERVRERLETENFRHDALLLAVNALSDASMNVRSGVAPRLAKTASAYLSRATDGKYDTLGVDGKINMTLFTDGGTREKPSLSAGTQDTVYLCLRLALAEVFFKNDMPPLVFDEITAKLDDSRLRCAVEVIRSAGQSLVFTCTDRESRMFAADGDVNFVAM